MPSSSCFGNACASVEADHNVSVNSSISRARELDDERLKKKCKHVVITAALVPEADDMEKSKLEEDIRREVEKIRIPWVRGELKVTIADYLFED